MSDARTDVQSQDPLQRRIARLQEATRALAAADPLTRERHVRAWLGLVPRLVSARGMDALYREAIRFDAAGGFAGTPWNDPARLRPRLWAGSFAADEPYPWMEVASTLRLLAVALGDTVHEGIDAEAARRFLERALALNLDKIIEGRTEAARIRRVKHHDVARHVLLFVIERLPRTDFLDDVAREIDDIMAQRPVWTHDVRNTLRLVSTIPGADEAHHPVLDQYVEAVLGPTPMSMRFRDPDEYAGNLAHDDADVDAECHGMAKRLRRTGLACEQHAALLRHVANDPARLGSALGLDARGQAVLEAHADRVADLVARTITPTTCQTAYGLARFLERGLLERSEVVSGLDAVASLTLPEELDRSLRQSSEVGDVEGIDILLGGAIRVLGQPLGVGQGDNPTCQSARGISMWASQRPGHLLDLLCHAARGSVAMDFEGQMLRSDELEGGLAPRLDPELDPVSLVLVPHLDRLYDAMMRLAAGRGEDAHKWVNSALYGGLVPAGYISCFDPVTWQVTRHDAMVRKYYATFHPDHHDAHPPVHAVPVGITVTDDTGRLLGLHAVSIQRVAPDDEGTVRVYFYNPNNEGRQDWGDGIQPSVRDHGEEEGESSLPFAQFGARLYAMHHPIPLAGDPASVPGAQVEAVTRAARRTWGRSYAWVG